LVTRARAQPARRRGARPGRARRPADLDAAAQPLPRRPPGAAPAARQARQAAAAVLPGAVRHVPAALRAPGQRPLAGHARLRLLPREPAARPLWPRGRSADHRHQDDGWKAQQRL